MLSLGLGPYFKLTQPKMRIARLTHCGDEDGLLVASSFLTLVDKQTAESFFFSYASPRLVCLAIVWIQFAKSYRSKSLWLRRFTLWLWFQPSFNGHGCSSFGADIVFKALGFCRSTWRIALSLPARCQRARSNAKTTRNYTQHGMSETLRSMGWARITLGPDFGIKGKKQKIQSKLKPKKGLKVAKKKGPVRRSRDTKKNIWA
jgi:hypothetical protein